MEAAARYREYLSGLFEWAVGPPRPELRVLDFGAGVGTYALSARDRGYEVECVEIDPSLRDRLHGLGLRCAGSLDEVPRNSIDLVYSFNVLEHIENDVGALADIRGVLRPGATLLLYVPALQILYSAMDRRVGHLRRYRRSELVDKVSQAGFEVRSCRYADSLGFVAGLAYRLVGGNSGLLKPKPVAFYDRFLFPPSRALDKVVNRWVGKNLVLLARRPR